MASLWVRGVAVTTLCLVLFGCAEVDRRGGFTDQIADNVLFRAETKSHRLLRSYAIVGALTTIARNARISEVDKSAAQGPLKAALEIADDAYNCLFPYRAQSGLAVRSPVPVIQRTTANQNNSQMLTQVQLQAYAQARIQTSDQPSTGESTGQKTGNEAEKKTEDDAAKKKAEEEAAKKKAEEEARRIEAEKKKRAVLPDPFYQVEQSICIYFDERMTRLDYAIYKLASTILFDPDSRKLLADIQEAMFFDVPVVGPAWKAATRAAEATNEAAKAAFQTTGFVNSLLTLSVNVSGRAVYLLPIYRDTLEFDMRLVLQSLQYSCQVEKSEVKQAVDPYRYTVPDLHACSTFDRGMALFKNGNGDLSEWRDYLRGLNGKLYSVEAYPLHFALISRWIYRSCRQLFGGTAGDEQGAIKKTTMAKCGPLIEDTHASDRPTVVYLPSGPSYPIEAMRQQPTRYVRPSAPPAGQGPAYAVPPAPQRNTTGSGRP